MLKTQILNSKGENIVLNDMEAKRVQYNQQIANALGYEIDITTLTAISKRVTEQKFFELTPSEYLPVRAGDGAWATEIMTYRSFNEGDDFATGVVNTAAGNSRLAGVSTAVDSVTVPIKNWAKEINYTIFDLQHASRSGNWDLVSSLERSRKKNWDLGIQEVAFLGLKDNSNVDGLLTQADVNANTTLITKYISAMSETEFEALLGGIIGAYRTNSRFTAMPNRFVIPELDYNGLAVATSENFPLKSKLDRLLETFRTITRQADFQIMPCAYADQVNNSDVTGLDKNRYVLYNYEEESIRMDVPVPYTNTMMNTLNGAQFQNVGYGQFTGVKAYRPLETLYFDWAA